MPGALRRLAVSCQQPSSESWECGLARVAEPDKGPNCLALLELKVRKLVTFERSPIDQRGCEKDSIATDLTTGCVSWRACCARISCSASAAAPRLRCPPEVEVHDNRLRSFFSVHCFQRRCYSRIADTKRAGSESLPAGKERGQTFLRNAIASTRYDKLAANYLAFVRLASIRIWLRVDGSTPQKSGTKAWMLS